MSQNRSIYHNSLSYVLLPPDLVVTWLRAKRNGEGSGVVLLWPWMEGCMGTHFIPALAKEMRYHTGVPRGWIP